MANKISTLVRKEYMEKLLIDPTVAFEGDKEFEKYASKLDEIDARSKKLFGRKLEDHEDPLKIGMNLGVSSKDITDLLRSALDVFFEGQTEGYMPNLYQLEEID